MNAELFEKLAAPLTKDETSWRIDGKPSEKNGRFTARVVAYCDVPAIVRRLDRVAPGCWTFEASEPFGSADGDGVVAKAIKGTLTICGVSRSDYGIGPDEKQALTDAFKRTARLFGIALELWDMDPIWTEVSDGSKYPKITGDPWAQYAKQRSGGGRTSGPASAGTGAVGHRGPIETGAAPTTQSRPATREDVEAIFDAKADPGDYIMPIGKQKGQRIGDLPDEVLTAATKWVSEKNWEKKYPGFFEAVAKVITRRVAA